MLTELRSLPAFCVLVALASLCRPLPAEETPHVDLRGLKALDTNGKKHLPDDSLRSLGKVFVFLSAECPISRQYIPELNRLQKLAESPDSPIGFFGVLSDRSLTRRDAAKFVQEFGIAFPVLFDSSGELAALLRPEHVPESFVVSASDDVLYRGRIDDLYPELGKRRQEPTSRDLLNAIAALQQNQPQPVSRTAAVGCPYEASSIADWREQVNYTRDIAPLLHVHCVECHRPGEVAPFSLLTYQDAAKRAEGLSRVTESRLMPPWKAELNETHFLGERRLSDYQIALFKAWADSKRTEGTAADLPPAPVFTSSWRLGEPDKTLEVQTPFEAPADGPDIFQHFVLPVNNENEKTIVGFEFRPGNPAVIHHAIIYLDNSGRARKRDAETPEPGWRTSGSIDVGISGMVGVWTPGATPRFFSNNVGIPLDKGADIVMQLHIHPSGKPETDQSKMGLYFAKQPVAKVMSRNPLLLGSLAIEIPPGEKRHKLSSQVTLPSGLTLTSVLPHMHLIGKEMKVTATRPDGAVLPLIWIKDWSFYWQDSYVYRDAVHLPAGTILELEAYYDNSADNAFNPQQPPKTVLFGNDTTDEMCFALFQAVADEPDGMKAVGQAMMQTMMQDWNAAALTPAAQARIMVEVGKLFGQRRR